MYADKLDKTSLGCKLSAAAGDQELVAKYSLFMKKRLEIENRLVQKLGRLWGYSASLQGTCLKGLSECQPVLSNDGFLVFD